MRDRSVRPRRVGEEVERHILVVANRLVWDPFSLEAIAISGICSRACTSRICDRQSDSMIAPSEQDAELIGRRIAAPCCHLLAPLRVRRRREMADGQHAVQCRRGERATLVQTIQYRPRQTGGAIVVVADGAHHLR